MQAAKNKKAPALKVVPTSGKDNLGFQHNLGNAPLPDEEPEGSEDVMISFGQVPEDEERGTPAMIFPAARRLASATGENTCKLLQPHAAAQH